MKTRLCTVCNEAGAKYKCPKCSAGYCSVACYKVHKTEPCVSPEKNYSDGQQPRTQQHATSDTGKPSSLTIANAPAVDDEDEKAKHRLGPEDLKKLHQADRVKELLANPEIRLLLDAVRKDPNPVEAIRILRQRPDFEQLAQALICATKRVD
ncbi:hypothetical protein LPJ64_001740 [Coemansia asiatica]|uniref:HIT-type domain-containing protein n=1 Tax=Coemansia asiatica TaxID=1052880 RepID=A0A9W7XKS5_9FUNG|nr:hypothetical protein LPJ64_001740 [Coemansia asiatica]KAJ2854456.1 hypothetical protein FB639_006370 [Coemansia asiatica]